jgi:hypothetical protein
MNTATSYVHACSNAGRCRQLIFESHGYVWKPFWIDPETGVTHSTGIGYGLSKVNDIKFKCCIQCHKPVNAFEAIDLNKKLGFELPTVDDLLLSIKKLPTLAELLEGLG